MSLNRILVQSAATTITLSILFAATGCAVDIPGSSRTAELLPPSKRAQGLRDPQPATLLRVDKKVAPGRSQPVSLNMHNVALITVFNTAVPNEKIVPVDGGVDLSKKVSAQVKNGTLGDLLDQLTVDANYDFQIHGSTIEVASSSSKTWNLAAVAAARYSSGSVGSQQANIGGGQGGNQSGDSSGSSDSSNGNSNSSVSSSISSSGQGNEGSGGSSNRGISTSVNNNEDEWDALINTARTVMGIDPVSGGGGGSGSSDDGAAAAAGISKNGHNSLIAMRSQGLIRATGSPRRVHRLNEWMSTLEKSTTQQVHLDVKTMEVRLNDNRARGINWQALANSAIGDFNVKGLVGFNGPVDTSNFTSTPGGLSASLTGLGSNGDPDFAAVVKFLSQYGKVSLINEPNTTVTNGRTANLTTGREFSYIATIQQTVAGVSGAVIATPDVARILVGVKLAVTPRILPDNRILINVVPVITNLQGFDKFTVGDNTFQNPSIQLQSLATQVITRPGVPIHIGGLISDRLTSTLNSLPIGKETSSWFSKPVKWLFSSKNASLSRRELVITITPNLVAS